MSIRPYFGEYLVSPAPLHMGLNWCTHACFYCFANLNRPERRADYASIGQFLGKVRRREPGKDIAAWLALQGHPILASNDSDPFAISNGEQNLSLMRGMMDAGLRFVFQTRGGPGAMDMLDEHPPTMVYISFTTDMESIRRRAEPGAPSFEERKALAAMAREKGHFVIAGINPFYPPWWEDIESFVHWLAQQGIHHAWIGEPHLNHQQVAAISAKTKQKFPDEIEWFARGGMQRPPVWPALRTLCDQHGINTFLGSNSSSGLFWKPYFDLGYPFWPTIEGWFDRLRALGKRVAFTFDAFDQWADATSGLQSSTFKDYLTGIGRSIRNVGSMPRIGTMHAAHEYLWRIHEFPTRMRHDDIYIATQDGNLAIDDSGRFVLIYARESHDANAGRIDLDTCDADIGLEQDQGVTV